MAPSLLRRIAKAHPKQQTVQTFSTERGSWKSPEDILTLLMLIGGDIVQGAIAQLAGASPFPAIPFTPVAFSFGWLGYAVTALVGAMGDGRLTPEPDWPATLVNAQSGYARENSSWILGRLLRDHEHLALPRTSAGLTIAFFYTRAPFAPGRDWLWWTGVFVILAQLGISVIPGALHGDWLVLIITGGGTALALIGAGLSQWIEEKTAARTLDPDPNLAGRDDPQKERREVAILTRGNGKTFAMVVVSQNVGLRLEDLASGGDKKSLWTSIATAVLAVLWVVLLLTVEGLEGDAWYMLAVGGLGILQNLLAAGMSRKAAALGFQFREGDNAHIVPAMPGAVGSATKVMDVLFEAERKEPGVGISLLPIFFPGDLRKDEQKEWDLFKADRKTREENARAEEAARRRNAALLQTKLT